MGRPLLRWIPLVLGFLVSLWVFGPFIMDLGQPLPLPLHKDPLKPPHPPHPPPAPHHPFPPGPPTVWSTRADRVRDAFVHAYSGYHKHAYPYDELLPVEGSKVNNFNGWGVTVFDALDTMWIMGLHDAFHEALGLIAKSTFELKPTSYAPFFETVIRYLGGLLSAYALSGEPILLSRADDLGRMLLPAFETPSGLPMYAVNTVTGQTRAGWSGNVLWAEALSNQMEYKYLAHITGRMHYYHKTEHVMQKMYNATIVDGLFPTMWDVSSGAPQNAHYSVGAYADSAHEYLLKQWLTTGRSEPKALDLYLKSVSGIINNLLYITPNRELLYVTDQQNGIASHTLEHLSCFLPGLLALGVHTLPPSALDSKTKELHLWAAQGLAETCWATYVDQATGLGPDEVRMHNWGTGQEHKGRWMAVVEQWKEEGRPKGVPPGVRAVHREQAKEKWDYVAQKGGYLLRPETVESFYVLWRTTGDERWRERGWSVFESIEKHARTKFGYTSLAFVDEVPPPLKDEMPSYFLAETLKYLYLLFTDADILPLDKWVFNTEAHPLPVFDWSAWEREAYEIEI